eukprot:TRINITY_DN72436_c0_g1_i1.p1 TRINITY_DN72436_c0_g1~~TRINITY_DN72436_c0_g1_i1.p1  ORF type:complete len:437 (-),score=15.25 TRINITY_DN72436_c0_g1_i1:152-1462(-)
MKEVMDLKPKERGWRMTCALYNKEPDIARIALAVPGTEVNTQGPRGWTALCISAKYGWLDLIQILLARKADPNQACTTEVLRPLDLALTFHHAQSAVLLLSAGAKNSLRYAVEHNDVSLVRKLLDPLSEKECEFEILAPEQTSRSPMAIAQVKIVRRQRHGTSMPELLRSYLPEKPLLQRDVEMCTPYGSDNVRSQVLWRLRAAMLPCVNWNCKPLAGVDAVRICCDFRCIFRTCKENFGWVCVVSYSGRGSHLRECKGSWSSTKKGARADAAMLAVRLFVFPWWEAGWGSVPQICGATPALQNQNDELQHVISYLTQDGEWDSSWNERFCTSMKLMTTVLYRGLPWFPNDISPLQCCEIEGAIGFYVVPFGLLIQEPRFPRRCRATDAQKRLYISKIRTYDVGRGLLLSAAYLLGSLRYENDGRLSCTTDEAAKA